MNNINSNDALKEVWKTCYELKEWAVETQEENKRLLQVIEGLKEEHDCANCYRVMEEYDLSRSFRNRADVLSNLIYQLEEVYK